MTPSQPSQPVVLETGFYFVRIGSSDQWEPAFYTQSDGKWAFIGQDLNQPPLAPIQAIGERILTPEERAEEEETDPSAQTSAGIDWPRIQLRIELVKLAKIQRDMKDMPTYQTTYLEDVEELDQLINDLREALKC